jgi:AraC-like DNA-binding protein
MVGKTAKEYIQSCILLSSKRMLYFSDLSAKEIGYEMGFSEPANFSAFFKKHTGTAPSHYRESV